MLLNLRKMNGSSELKHIEVQQKVVGLRFFSVVIESREEAWAISRGEGLEWFVKHISPSFVLNKIE